MKLIWHIVWKDLWRLRWALVLWVGLIALKLGCGALLLWGNLVDDTKAGEKIFDAIRETANGLMALEVLAGCVLVVRLMHADKAVGTQAFWMTRPVAGSRLLAAKLGGLAVIFAMIPVAVSTPWWLACGYGPHEWLYAAAETMLWQALVVAVAAPIAVLTDGISRYLLWLLVMAVHLIPLLAMSFSGYDLGLFQHDGFRVALAASVAGLGIAAAQQILTRRFWRSVVIVVVVSWLLPALVLTGWPETANQTKQAAKKPAGPAFSLALGKVSVKGEGQVKNPELAITFEVGGWPETLVCESDGLEQEWDWSAGKLRPSLPWKIPPYSAGYNGAIRRALGMDSLDPETQRVTAETNYRHLAAKWEERMGRTYPRKFTPFDPGEWRISTRVSQLGLDRMRREPPSYLARAYFSLYRPELMDEQPVVAGASLTRDPAKARFAVVRHDNYSLGVTLVERAPAFYWDSPGGLLSLVPRRWERPFSIYVMIDRKRHRIQRYEPWGQQRARVGTVMIGIDSVSYMTKGFYNRQGEWVRRPLDVAGLTLAKMTLREVEQFTKELRVDKFLLDPAEKTEGK